MPAISSNPDQTQAQIDRRRGRFVPWIIVAFYVAFMSGFMAFVVIAFHNPPNEYTAEAYAKGLAYNETLAKADAQAKLGWRTQAVYSKGHLDVALSDSEGRPLDGARVRAWFVHPSVKAHDRAFDLRPDGAGRYSVAADLPVEAVWKVHVTAEQGGRQFQSMIIVEGR
ncbi:fixH family protein [Asticcacaulis biprosthecium C19]|uniref:FixH family protein n=1 Tax=Asticcacaulis biprosthecium C19 TaxID=715226 RepID=F4QTG6_9CAUL|nr:FixH family protein [Asticcacaulis biprosthecium]EGF90036.1 fixH family protein [Asticcacaulis biprosthecium C19]